MANRNTNDSNDTRSYTAYSECADHRLTWRLNRSHGFDVLTVEFYGEDITVSYARCKFCLSLFRILDCLTSIQQVTAPVVKS